MNINKETHIKYNKAVKAANEITLEYQKCLKSNWRKLLKTESFMKNNLFESTNKLRAKLLKIKNVTSEEVDIACFFAFISADMIKSRKLIVELKSYENMLFSHANSMSDGIKNKISKKQTSIN